MKQDIERYNRQIILKGFGPESQRKLSHASVLVVGAGGLGCPALQYLTGAGIGVIGLVDHDRVSLSNLHRQVLYDMADIGEPKVLVAAQKMSAANPDISIQPFPFAITKENCLDLIRDFDIILDCCDNFSTRYLLNDACALLGKPLIFGAVSGWEGQLAVFHRDDLGIRTNYRDLFPLQPLQSEIPNCEDNGVIGVLPGIIGTMQAAEAIKLITAIGQPLINRLLNYNLMQQQFYAVSIMPAPWGTYQLPASPEGFRQMNYGAELSQPEEDIEFIDAAEMLQMVGTSPSLVIDVRATVEQPKLLMDHLQIPMPAGSAPPPPAPEHRIIFVCQHGYRSEIAARAYQARFPLHQHVYTLSGGIDRWKDQIQYLYES